MQIVQIMKAKETVLQEQLADVTTENLRLQSVARSHGHLELSSALKALDSPCADEVTPSRFHSNLIELDACNAVLH